MSSKLLAYAVDFTSFLLQKIKQREHIKAIILFGSVARDEDDKQSDVDIFIDIVQKDSKIEKECLALVDSFLSSVKYSHYCKLLDVHHEIKLHIGQLYTWKELAPSLISDGIVLYGKYTPPVK